MQEPQKSNDIIVLTGLAFIMIFAALGFGIYGKTDRPNPPAEIRKISKNDISGHDGPQKHDYFAEFVQQSKKLPARGREVSLIAVGDVSFSRGAGRAAKASKDPDYLFKKVSGYLSASDLVFGNLETPITPGRPILDGEMVFRSDPDSAQALKRAGFTIVSLANNHTPNFGEKGLGDTFDYLTQAGISYAGAGTSIHQAYAPAYIEKKGFKFAFLAYNDDDVVPDGYEAGDKRAGTAFMREDKMAESVQQAKIESDFVIVSMHSGTEYKPKPNERQVKFARAAIDAGADVVIGHHPHVVQTMERYKGKFIFYSLGNFAFDQPWSQDTKDSLAVKLYFGEKGLDKITFFPAVMEKVAQPRPAQNEESERILKRLDFGLDNQTVFFWEKDKQTFDSDYLPAVYVNNGSPASAGRSVHKSQSHDIGDGKTADYALLSGRLEIKNQVGVIWQSPKDWWIDDFAVADADNDNQADIDLSLWRSGNFGSSQPFWVHNNDPSIKNHFFVMELSDGSLKQKWGSSNLTAPNCEFKLADIDQDGQNDLIAIEGEYIKSTECRGRHVAVWKWNGWGFSSQWRSKEGNFSNLEIGPLEGKNIIYVDNFP